MHELPVFGPYEPPSFPPDGDRAARTTGDIPALSDSGDAQTESRSPSGGIEPVQLRETNVSEMLARAGAYSLRLQSLRAVEAMALCDGLRALCGVVTGWARVFGAELMHRYLGTRACMYGCITPEQLYGVPHEVAP